MKIILNNITQAYTQSKTELNHIVIYHLFVKLKKKYPKDTILYIVKLLYNLAKVGNYQFATYLDHYKEKLEIEKLFYDICLFITKDGGENFDITGHQTNNTLNVGMEIFINKEKSEIIKVKFKAKSQTIQKNSISGDLNSCHMTIEDEFIIVIQKILAEKLLLIDIKDNTKK